MMSEGFGDWASDTLLAENPRDCAPQCIYPRIGGYAGSTMGMSILRFLGLKLMPMSVTGRLPPIHLSA